MLPDNERHHQWVARDEEVVWHGFTQMATFAANSPLVVHRGEGRYVFDTEDRRYLDAISSLWVVTLGHCVPELNDALTRQASRIAHSTLLGNGCDATVLLAEALAEVVPVDRPRFLFASDGASAVEQALKIAYQSWRNRGVTGRTLFAALEGAYHGDTFGALSVGDSGFYSEAFAPLKFPVVRGRNYSDLARVVSENADRLAGVIVEPLVQAAAGMACHESSGLLEVAAACRAASVPLIVDEVATGFGRTGSLFACNEAGVRPDIACLGKAMTGGYLPMSATAVTSSLADTFLGPDLSAQTLYHGHSFSGNALCAAVALRHLDLLSEWNVLANVKERSVQLAEGLDRIARGRPVVSEVRSKGLFAAVELDTAAVGDPLLARKVCSRAVEHGVVLRSIGPAVTTVPMLTSTYDEIDRIVWTIAECIDEVGRG